MTKRRWAFMIAAALLLVPAYYFLGPMLGARSGASHAQSGRGLASAATVPAGASADAGIATAASGDQGVPTGTALRSSASRRSSGRSAASPARTKAAAGDVAPGAEDAGCSPSWARSCGPNDRLLDDTLAAAGASLGSSDGAPMATEAPVQISPAARRGMLGAVAGLAGGGIALALKSGGLAASVDNTGGTVGNPSGPSGPSGNDPPSDPPGPTTATPEPLTGTLLGLGLMGWAATELRRRRHTGETSTDAGADGIS